jgi:hypothetical protein
LDGWPGALISLGLCIGTGVAFLAMMPILRPVKVACIVVYIPIVGVMVIYYFFCFVGVVFGEWL